MPPEYSGSRDRGPVGAFLPRGACDPKVPEEPLQLRRGGYTADTNANIARGVQHAKEMEGGKKEAHREGAVERGGGIGNGFVGLPGACGNFNV